MISFGLSPMADLHKLTKLDIIGIEYHAIKFMTTNKVNLDSLNVNPSGGGIFGFGNFAEIWNGRMAMLGIAAALIGEVLTGKGILGQVGITSPGGGILVALFLTGFTIATTMGYYAIKLNKVEETESPSSAS